VVAVAVQQQRLTLALAHPMRVDAPEVVASSSMKKPTSTPETRVERGAGEREGRRCRTRRVAAHTGTRIALVLFRPNHLTAPTVGGTCPSERRAVRSETHLRRAGRARRVRGRPHLTSATWPIRCSSGWSRPSAAPTPPRSPQIWRTAAWSSTATAPGLRQGWRYVGQRHRHHRGATERPRRGPPPRRSSDYGPHPRNQQQLPRRRCDPRRRQPARVRERPCRLAVAPVSAQRLVGGGRRMARRPGRRPGSVGARR